MLQRMSSHVLLMSPVHALRLLHKHSSCGTRSKKQAMQRVENLLAAYSY